MTDRTAFQQKFEAFDAPLRAALVFRYREDLPLSHVAELVGRPPDRIAREMAAALAELQESGALPRSAARPDPGHCAAEGELAMWLDKLRDDPALSSFRLVLAVRAARPRRRRVRRHAG